MEHRCLKFDYFGIVLAMTVMPISATYFGLNGDPLLQIFYITMILCFATAVFYSLLGPDADGPRSANWRLVRNETLMNLADNVKGHPSCRFLMF